MDEACAGAPPGLADLHRHCCTNGALLSAAGVIALGSRLKRPRVRIAGDARSASRTGVAVYIACKRAYRRLGARGRGEDSGDQTYLSKFNCDIRTNHKFILLGTFFAISSLSTAAER